MQLCIKFFFVYFDYFVHSWWFPNNCLFSNTYSVHGVLANCTFCPTWFITLILLWLLLLSWSADDLEVWFYLSLRCCAQAFIFHAYVFSVWFSTEIAMHVSACLCSFFVGTLKSCFTTLKCKENKYDISIQHTLQARTFVSWWRMDS